MEKEMQDILRQITELESQLTIRKTKTEQLKQDLNYSTMEQQKELQEVNRLQQCNQSLQSKIDMQKEIVEQENNKEIFDNFMKELGGILKWIELQ